MTERVEREEGGEGGDLRQRHCGTMCFFNFNISEAYESYFTQWPRKNDK